jgi:tetratricopeptide (TPR) repeat protein
VPHRVFVIFVLVVCSVIGFADTVPPADKRLPAATPGPIVARLRTDARTRQGFEHFYNMEYDRAIREFEQVLQAHPDDPFAVNHLLSAVMFKEFYRIGALDTELYANDSFISSRQLPPDPKVRAQVKELIDRAMALSERRLQANPNDVDALYARGVTRGMKSTYMAMVDKSWFAALRSAVSARRDHEHVLQLDPKYVDAKMSVGLHNYVMGSVSWPVKIAASVIGLSGSKKTGIQYLYEAANGGGETAVDANIALSLFLRREQRYQEAIALVNRLFEAYPKNFFVALERANLYNASGHAPEAIAAYRKLLDDGHKGVFPESRLEQAAYGLGEALRGQRDFTGAAEAYDMVARYKEVEPELLDRSNLAAGQMYDVLQKRELATKKYHAVLSVAKPNSPNAEQARKYLKQAYRFSEKRA